MAVSAAESLGLGCKLLVLQSADDASRSESPRSRAVIPSIRCGRLEHSSVRMGAGLNVHTSPLLNVPIATVAK